MYLTRLSPVSVSHHRRCRRHAGLRFRIHWPWSLTGRQPDGLGRWHAHDSMSKAIAQWKRCQATWQQSLPLAQPAMVKAMAEMPSALTTVVEAELNAAGEHGSWLRAVDDGQCQGEFKVHCIACAKQGQPHYVVSADLRMSNVNVKQHHSGIRHLTACSAYYMQTGSSGRQVAPHVLRPWPASF